MNLTDRLSYLANQINKGETMADIGTDHGFLPIYLTEKGICEKAIMCDISSGSLDKARENCMKHNSKHLWDLRLGNGLEKIAMGEVDVIVIAGMGGILMTKIIGDDIEKSRSFRRFILQPRNNHGYLRKWLYENGFYIIDEGIVDEDSNLCEIITAVPICQHHYEYPINLLCKPSSIVLEYLRKEYQKIRNINEKIKVNSSDLTKYYENLDKLSWLEYLISKREENESE